MAGAFIMRDELTDYAQVTVKSMLRAIAWHPARE
jgi:hypothetical protein